MKSIFLFILISISFSGVAQIGLHYRYQDFNVPQWKAAPYDDGFNFRNGYDIGIDYWLRMKNVRIEYTPEFFISNLRGNHRQEAESELRRYGISGNINVYILDFVGDCDCPTFSKQGNFFTKGLFLSAAPQIEYRQLNYSFEENTLEDKGFKFATAFGLGLDIGIVDLLTLTPYFRYKFVINEHWQSMDEFTQSNNHFILKNPQFGIRLGFRPDYVREQRRFRRKW